MTEVTLPEVTRIAERVRKPTKQDAQNTIIKLIDNGMFDNAEEAAGLYKYFMPARPRRIKDARQWVAQAIAQKDVRIFMNYVYSDGLRIFATDGHRSHILEPLLEDPRGETIPAGFYDRQFNPVELDARFPSDAALTMIRADHEYGEPWFYEVENLEVVVSPKWGKHLYKLPSGLHVQKHYFDQATAVNRAGHYRQTSNPYGDRILLRFGARSAMIMEYNLGAEV